jgi:hypothetical protein
MRLSVPSTCYGPVPLMSLGRYESFYGNTGTKRGGVLSECVSSGSRESRILLISSSRINEEGGRLSNLAAERSARAIRSNELSRIAFEFRSSRYQMPNPGIQNSTYFTRNVGRIAPTLHFGSLRDPQKFQVPLAVKLRRCSRYVALPSTTSARRFPGAVRCSVLRQVAPSTFIGRPLC